MTLNKLFTYGTLCSNFNNPNAVALQKKSTLLGKAQIKGKIYLINHSYPGLIQTEGNSTWVHGEIWLLHEPIATLLQLDEYEGCSPNSMEPFEYSRAIRHVSFGDDLIEAWVYLYRLSVDHLQEIALGYFQKHS